MTRFNNTSSTEDNLLDDLEDLDIDGILNTVDRMDKKKITELEDELLTRLDEIENLKEQIDLLKGIS